MTDNSDQPASEVEEAPKVRVYKDAVDYVLNVPIETDEDLASLGHIYTD